jgi:hypothetical protein
MASSAKEREALAIFVRTFHMSFRSFVRCIGICCVIPTGVCTLGCSKTKHKVVAVEGKLTYADGSALPSGTKLLFNPGEGRVGTAVGVTQADGTFRVKHNTGRSGAEEGKYAIQLGAPDGDDGSFFKTIPKEYYDPGIFTAEVKPGMSPLALKVEKPKK